MLACHHHTLQDRSPNHYDEQGDIGAPRQRKERKRGVAKGGRIAREGRRRMASVQRRGAQADAQQQCAVDNRLQWRARCTDAHTSCWTGGCTSSNCTRARKCMWDSGGLERRMPRSVLERTHA
jgi:hypothetical protein